MSVTPSITPTVTSTSIQPTIVVAEQSYYLAALALISVVIALFLVFYFSRRITLQTHLRNTLVDASVSLQAEKGIRELQDKAWLGPLDSDHNQFPSEAEDINLSWDLWLSDKKTRMEALYLGELDTRSYQEYLTAMGLTPQQYPEPVFNATRQREKAVYEKRKLGIEKYKEWEKKEQAIFYGQKDAVIARARQEVEKTIPRSMDVSILGTGFSFLLEFSTVFVIIFAVIIMGILGVLEGREIATILAAIAGYVLGKATARQSADKEVEKIVQTVKARANL